MELYRKELKLAVIKGLDESRGSSNVPIKLTHDTSDEYINYTEQIHIRYLFDNQVKEEILPTNDNGFYIPGKPLSHDGPIELAVHLINGDIELVTNELSFVVKNAPNGTTQVDPSEFTWQQLVDQYVNAKLDTFADKADMNEFKGDVNANLSNQDKKISAQNSKIATLESRMNTFTRLSEGSTTGDAELKDIRVGANGVTYNTAGDAVRGQYSQLKEDLDTLNKGGLNLKEDFISKQVNEWLDAHPEATTTVEDGSLTETKMHPDFLPLIKNNYITPQMFGAIGDGVNDDTTAIQMALDYIAENQLLLKVSSMYSVKTLYFPSGKYNVLGNLHFNSSKLILKGDDSAIIGNGNNTILTFSEYGHQVRIDDLTFLDCGCGLSFNVKDVDQSIIEVNSCNFSDCKTAILYNNRSSMLTVNSSHFRKCDKILNLVSGDNVMFRDCWLFDTSYNKDNDVSIIHSSAGDLKFENCFFIPCGSDITKKDLAWIEMNGSHGASVYVNNCRLSAEKGYKTLVNFKGNGTGEDIRYRISVINCPYLNCRDAIIRLYTFSPVIELINNQINATTKFVDVKENFNIRLRDTVPQSTYYANLINIFGNTTKIPDMYINMPNDLCDITNCDKPIMKSIATTDYISKWLGYFSFDYAMVTRSFLIDVSYWRSNVNNTGYRNMKYIVTIFSEGGKHKISCNEISNTSSDVLVCDMTIENNTTKETLEHVTEFNVASNNYGYITLNFKIDGSTYTNLSLSSKNLI